MKRRKEGKGPKEGVVAMSLGKGILQMLRHEGFLGDHLVLF